VRFTFKQFKEYNRFCTSIHVHWKLIKGIVLMPFLLIQPKILLYFSYVQMKVNFAARQRLVISESHILLLKHPQCFIRESCYADPILS